MSSVTHLSFPVIDFSKLDLKHAGTAEWESVKSEAWKTIEEYGGFQALYGKIPEEVHKAFLQEMEELFDLPLETKKSSISDKPFGGYYKMSSSTTSNESFNIFDANIVGNMKTFSDVLWPKGKPSFNNTVESFSKHLSELGNIISTMILESLGMEKYIEEHMNSTSDLLRIIKYQNLQTTDQTNLAIQPHIDPTLLSIVYQNQAEGLEVQTKNGQWIKLKLSPNTFMVFIGESFSVWTNRRLPCLYHRVKVSGNKAKYASGWFPTFKEGYMVKAPEEMVDEEHPLSFQPFDFFEYLKYLLSSEGSKSSALSDYCGV